MSFRLFKIARYYPDNLEQFYAAHPGLESGPYAAQYAALMAESIGMADFYTRAFDRLGYETQEVVANAAPMQQRWAREHGVEVASENWMQAIAIAQIKHFQPEVLFVTGGSAVFKADDLRRLRVECPSIRLMLVATGAPSDDLPTFAEFDLIISNIPELVQHFRQHDLSAHLVHHAFAPEILDRIDTSAPPRVDFAFSGSVLKTNRYHHERERLLAELVRRTDLQVWSKLRRLSRKQITAQRARQLAYDAVQGAQRIGIPEKMLAALPGIGKVARWPDRPSLDSLVDQRIARRANPPLYGLVMYQLLHDSRIVLNTHIDASTNSASNMRLYEATGVGACLLTDWKDNLADLFAPDSEVVTYRSAAECVEKVRYLLDHEDERREIAAAGQRRTLRDHTVARRVEQLHDLITGRMARA
ncbi:MAG: glycosyltransferase family 1 protein [Anaerolineae bacterium]|nr:glycosyltransferase family 1 protein [Anaerolineae bacterium]